MNTNNNQATSFFSYDDSERRDFILNLIQNLGIVSAESISIITGLNKVKVYKVLKSLASHNCIRVMTQRKTTYWGVAQC